MKFFSIFGRSRQTHTHVPTYRCVDILLRCMEAIWLIFTDVHLIFSNQSVCYTKALHIYVQ